MLIINIHIPKNAGTTFNDIAQRNFGNSYVPFYEYLAKRNLQDSFAGFGPSERFDEALLLFSRALKWKRVTYTQANVGVDRPRKQEFDPRSLRRIEECNALDMELYEWSLRLFDEKLREYGIGPGDLMVQTVSNWLFGAAQRVRQTAYRMQANSR